MWLALLLSITLTLLLKRAAASVSTARQFSTSRAELFLTLSLLLFVVWSAASMLWATSWFAAFHYTLVWSGYALFFLLMRRVAERPRLLRASLTTLGVIIFIVSAASIACFWSGVESPLRYAWGLGEPLATTIPLFVALALNLRRRRTAALCAVVAVSAWLAMLQTLERAPFIGAGIALITLAAITLAVSRFRPRSILRALALFAVFAAATALQTIPSPATQAQPSVVTRLTTTAVTETNTSARLLFWGVGGEMLRAHPVTGVGANNYEVVYPAARARFSSRYPGSTLVEINEGFLIQRAHNEYIQIAAELGAVGIVLFIAFGAALVWAAYLALRRARGPLVPGAICGLLAFAISSGASSISFRWMGSGLMFFFAAALVLGAASRVNARRVAPRITLPPVLMKRAAALALAVTLFIFCSTGIQAVNVTLHGAAQASVDRRRAEQFYRAALRWNPYDPATHYDYGIWLYYQERAGEAVPHLRYATAHGFNSSVGYAYLVAAEAAAGCDADAEQTLARAVEVYPRSVFLRVRHAAALAQLNRTAEAEKEYERALATNARAARGWWQLINNGVAAAARAARHDTLSIAMPGELQPEPCVHVVLSENERRNLSSDSAARARLLPAPAARDGE